MSSSSSAAKSQVGLHQHSQFWEGFHYLGSSGCHTADACWQKKNYLQTDAAQQLSRILGWSRLQVILVPNWARAIITHLATISYFPTVGIASMAAPTSMRSVSRGLLDVIGHKWTQSHPDWISLNVPVTRMILITRTMRMTRIIRRRPNCTQTSKKRLNSEAWHTW